MLRGIHVFSQNRIGRAITAAILGIIAISFGIWGIGDIFRNFGRSTLAKVGGTEIGIEQFRQTYQDRMQQLSRRLGRVIPPDQARALGLDRQLLGQVLAETALDEDVKQLKLGLTDAEIARRITTDPNFRGPSGQFDPTRFEQIIRQAGFTEARYVAEQRKVSLRRQIGQSVSGGFVVPTTSIDAQYQYDNEGRSIEYVVLGAAQAGDIPTPTPEVLSKYYEDNKVLFRAPEYRKLELLVLTPSEIARTIEISDEDAKKYYDEQHARFVTPERREIQQIVFPNAEDAKAAAERIAQGTPFTQIATDRGLKESDINLGKVTKASMLDPNVANAAFALQPGTVSEPITGQFGTVLVRVGEVEPEKVRPFDDAKADIKRDLAIERAKSQIADQRDKIEDERGAGAPLAQIAKKLNFPTRVIDAVDRAGRDPNGAPVSALPQSDMLNAAFASDVGVENDAVAVPGGGFIWYEVLGITPSRDRPFDEVKDKVEERWRAAEIANRLKAKATEMTEQAKGSNLTDLANAAGVKVQTATGIKRRQPAPGISGDVLAAVFRTGKGEVANAEGEQPGDRVVFRVTDINVPKVDANSAEAKQIADNLRSSYLEEIMSEYVVKLESDLGTTVNESALAQVFGGPQQ